ncbi:MAG: hypothetical protein ACTS22_02070 [Phycisphaerales bacterium]
MKRLIASAAVLALAGSATADITTTVFEITATNANGTATWSYQIDESQTQQGDYSWLLDQGIELVDQSNGNTIATLGWATVETIADPVVSVGFTVFATQQQTSFQINSTLLSFPVINAAVGIARASAGVTIDDFGGGGATFTPGPNGAYQAFFNNGADQFTSLFGSQLSVGDGENVAFSADTGAFAPAGVNAVSMSANWDFTLSPGDLATGTSTFELIPAPASGLLLGLGGLAAARRRR